MSIVSIIAAAIADGEAVEAAMSAATRVESALHAVGPKMREAMTTEPYLPVEFPKWVGEVLVQSAEHEASLLAVEPAEEATPVAPVVPLATTEPAVAEPVAEPASEPEHAPEPAAEHAPETPPAA